MAVPTRYEYSHEQAEMLLRAAEVKIPGTLHALEMALRKAGMWPEVDGEGE